MAKVIRTSAAACLPTASSNVPRSFLFFLFFDPFVGARSRLNADAALNSAAAAAEEGSAAVAVPRTSAKRDDIGIRIFFPSPPRP